MKFLVIGESCNDRFIYGSVDRICPEAPVPVFRQNSKSEVVDSLGMAGNVVANLRAITSKNYSTYCQIDLITNSHKGYKTRFVDSHSNQLLLRVDSDEHFGCFDLKLHHANLECYDVIIVSDYDKGFLTRQDLAKIASSCSSPVLFLDTKKKFSHSLGGFDFIKINEKEYSQNGFKQNSLNYSDQLIVTLGKDGCMYKDRKFPCPQQDSFNVSGAGDTFLAAFAFKYVTGKPRILPPCTEREHLEKELVHQAIQYAQECCSKVVSQKGVCTI